ncbi:hypothetical protein LZ32DRAFT_373371 [Colletotrichum eremochloae]|nr:hypothetical protein LZ32DRAFT_373371 [Colletotrichum eremochloae]
MSHTRRSSKGMLDRKRPSSWGHTSAYSCTFRSFQFPNRKRNHRPSALNGDALHNHRKGATS